MEDIHAITQSYLNLSQFSIEEYKMKKISGYFVDSEYNRNLNGLIKTMIDKNLKVVTINCDIIFIAGAR